MEAAQKAAEESGEDDVALPKAPYHWQLRTGGVKLSGGSIEDMLLYLQDCCFYMGTVWRTMFGEHCLVSYGVLGNLSIAYVICSCFRLYCGIFCIILNNFIESLQVYFKS